MNGKCAKRLRVAAHQAYTAVKPDPKGRRPKFRALVRQFKREYKALAADGIYPGTGHSRYLKSYHTARDR